MSHLLLRPLAFALPLQVLTLALLGSAAVVHAAPHQDINTLATYYGFPPPSFAHKTVTLRSAYTTMIFYKGSRKMLFNGDLIWLNDATTAKSTSWTIPSVDARDLIDPLLRPEVALKNRNVSLVVLDPGHGGRDSGAIGPHRNVYEKKAVLDIAKRTARKLQSAGIRTRLTRDRDQSLSLAARSLRARRWGADLFVSIHLNSSTSAIASGIETYTLTAAGFPSTAGGNAVSARHHGNLFDAENSILGLYVHRAVHGKAGGADRGLRHARFQVLREAPCPAVLVECGFLSHKADEANIIRQSHRDAIAQGIAEGIMAYIGKCGK